jgi:hypothetical protein
MSGETTLKIVLAPRLTAKLSRINLRVLNIVEVLETRRSIVKLCHNKLARKFETFPESLSSLVAILTLHVSGRKERDRPSLLHFTLGLRERVNAGREAIYVVYHE